MRRSHKALLALTLVALVVGIVNGVLDIYVKAAQTFTASAVTPYGEDLKIRIRCDSGRPPFLWILAWRVGGTEVTTVTNAVTITVTGSNIASTATVDYYIKAVSDSDPSKWTKTLQGSGVSVSVGGSALENTTGAVDIDTHLQDLGLNTTQDQTVDYYVWVRVTATGLISGQQLVAEVVETLFDSVTYDYGVVGTFTMGYTGTGDGSQAAEKRILGTSSGVTAPQNGTLDWIKARLQRESGYSGTLRIKAALYEHIGSNWDAGAFIAETQEKTWTSSFTWGWKRFDFSDPKPQVTAGTSYFLVIWVESDGDTLYGEVDLRRQSDTANRAFYISKAYGGTWPDPMNNEIKQQYSYCIYAQGSYSDWTASWSWWNLPPLSITAIPAGQQLIACIAVVITTAIVINAVRKRRKSRGRRRR